MCLHAACSLGPQDAVENMYCIPVCSTGQKPVLKSKQGAFQIIETTSVFRPLCKYTKQVACLAASLEADCDFKDQIQVVSDCRLNSA
jgi:hypothetical protein